MEGERRTSEPLPGIAPRGSDRRHELRRVAARNAPDRRQHDRRRLAKGAVGVMLAGATFATGSLRTFQRHDGSANRDDASAKHIVLGGDDEAKDDVAPGLELPVYLNAAVEGAMDRFSGSGRVGFEAALQRGGPVLADIQKVFAEEGVPPDLAYVALVESEFKPQAQSGAAARGVWQFMPKTGKALGLAQDFWVDERSDTVKSTRAAAQYLKHLHDKFGDWDMALAAYNYGEGNVEKAIKKTGATDYWQLSASGALPRETRDYVPRIHAAIMMAKNPAKYGIDVKPAAFVATEAVEVPESTDLRVVASCTGADLGQLMELNPALKMRATPMGRSFQVRVPGGKGAEVERCVAELPASERIAVQKHTVSSGQTLGAIAKRYNTRTSDILRVNHVNPKRIAKGTELLIPKAGVLAD